MIYVRTLPFGERLSLYEEAKKLYAGGFNQSKISQNSVKMFMEKIGFSIKRKQAIYFDEKCPIWAEERKRK